MSFTAEAGRAIKLYKQYSTILYKIIYHQCIIHFSTFQGQRISSENKLMIILLIRRSSFDKRKSLVNIVIVIMIYVLPISIKAK